MIRSLYKNISSQKIYRRKKKFLKIKQIMNIQRTKILLISASGKTGGGPSHIFLLKELLEDEFDFYLAMPSFNSKSMQFDNNKYLKHN